MQYITYARTYAPGQGNQHPCATADQDSVMDDSVQGPTTMKKHKIKDRETWESGAATYSISQKETTKSTTMLMLQWKSYKILFSIF